MTASRDYDIPAIDAAEDAAMLQYAERMLEVWRERAEGKPTNSEREVMASYEAEIARRSAPDYAQARDWIRGPDCVHGHLYALRSRNLTFGVWDETRDGFVGIREKMTETFLFVEYHYDTGAPFGTATPWVDLGPCPITDLAEFHKIDAGDGTVAQLHQTNEVLFAWLLEQERLYDWDALIP